MSLLIWICKIKIEVLGMTYWDAGVPFKDWDFLLFFPFHFQILLSKQSNHLLCSGSFLTEWNDMEASKRQPWREPVLQHEKGATTIFFPTFSLRMQWACPVMWPLAFQCEDLNVLRKSCAQVSSHLIKVKGSINDDKWKSICLWDIHLHFLSRLVFNWPQTHLANYCK